MIPRPLQKCAFTFVSFILLPLIWIHLQSRDAKQRLAVSQLLFTHILTMILLYENATQSTFKTFSVSLRACLFSVCLCLKKCFKDTIWLLTCDEAGSALLVCFFFSQRLRNVIKLAAMYICFTERGGLSSEMFNICFIKVYNNHPLRDVHTGS